ncbi:MAG: hypothetical protein AAB581_01995 [Patescibacteria group bacterium]
MDEKLSDDKKQLPNNQNEEELDVKKEKNREIILKAYDFFRALGLEAVKSDYTQGRFCVDLSNDQGFCTSFRRIIVEEGKIVIVGSNFATPSLDGAHSMHDDFIHLDNIVKFTIAGKDEDIDLSELRKLQETL